MLISHIRHLRENEGVADFRTAVVQGATERLVPILMTALAAGLALIPIAMSMGEPGSEIQAPMAMVILFGLVSSTALNMIVVPVLYDRFGSRMPDYLESFEGGLVGGAFGGVVLIVIGGTSSVPSGVRTDVATINQSPPWTSG